MNSLLTTPDSQFIIVSGHDRHIYGDYKSYILAGNIEMGEYQILQAGDDVPTILFLPGTKNTYILAGVSGIGKEGASQSRDVPQTHTQWMELY